MRIYDQAVATSAVAVEESDVETSYGRTHVLIAGSPDARPLVALHAKSFSSTMWLPMLPLLSAGHRVHMVDAVGDLNKSIASRVLSSPRHVAAWLRETTTALGVTRSAVVGASMGTWMATQYAMEYPERVERLALICPAGIVSNQHPRWLMSAMVTTAIRPTPERLRAFVASMATPSGRARLQERPWHEIVEQFARGLPGFRTKLNEARPTRCDIARLGQVPASGVRDAGLWRSSHQPELIANRQSATP